MTKIVLTWGDQRVEAPCPTASEAAFIGIDETVSMGDPRPEAVVLRSTTPRLVLADLEE